MAVRELPADVRTLDHSAERALTERGPESRPSKYRGTPANASCTTSFASLCSSPEGVPALWLEACGHRKHQCRGRREHQRDPLDHGRDHQDAASSDAVRKAILRITANDLSNTWRSATGRAFR